MTLRERVQRSFDVSLPRRLLQVHGARPKRDKAISIKRIPKT